MNNNFLIIILNYINWQDTSECINSLKESGVNDSNILIVENSSPNDSFEKLKSRFYNVKIICTEENIGFAGGNNIGIKYALDNNFEYAILLNNDTIIEKKNSISLLISEMENCKEATLGSGRIFYYPEKDKLWYDGGELVIWRGMGKHYNYKKKVSEIRLNNQPRFITFISGCYLCIRLRDFTKLGYLDEKFFMYLEDVDYCAKAVKQNLKILYYPESVIYHKSLGEEKRTPNVIYYSIRNRKLLINKNFGLITKIYFEIVLIIKRIIWFLVKKSYFNILTIALKDYNSKYFGKAPELFNNEAKS